MKQHGVTSLDEQLKYWSRKLIPSFPAQGCAIAHCERADDEITSNALRTHMASKYDMKKQADYTDLLRVDLTWLHTCRVAQRARLRCRQKRRSMTGFDDGAHAAGIGSPSAPSAVVTGNRGAAAAAAASTVTDEAPAALGGESLCTLLERSERSKCEGLRRGGDRKAKRVKTG